MNSFDDSSRNCIDVLMGYTINSYMENCKYKEISPKAIQSIIEGYVNNKVIINNEECFVSLDMYDPQISIKNNKLNDVEGSVNKTTMSYIIRNHDLNILNKQKADFTNIANYLNRQILYCLLHFCISESIKIVNSICSSRTVEILIILRYCKT